jgi:glycosyltransferase involved in cell wall biosynthesis
MEAKRPLKILQIISSATTSGAEKHVVHLSQLLQKDGHYVEVLCPPGGWLGEQCRAYGVPVYESEMKGKGWIRTASFVARKLRQENFDLVHTHLTRATYFGAISGFVANKPAVASVHVANHDQIYKRMARGKNRLVAVSNYVKGMLHGRGVPDRFIDTVYNGTDFIDYDLSDGQAVRRELGIESEKKLIGIVGRVCAEKGHLIMVRAMKDIVREHPNAHLVLVGRIEESFKEAFADEVKAQGLENQITTTGVRNDVARLLDAMEFTSMPSRQETFGIAAIESMARRRPVIASRVGGLPEVVRHNQSGLLVDLRPESVAEAADYLLSNPSECQAMGEAGRIIVERKFTLRAMANQLTDVYQKAVCR